MKWLLVAALSMGMVSEYPTPGIREEQKVEVNGSTEVWRLEWRTPPRPACGPSDISLTCPCQGFAYGEAGDLDVLRLFKGREIDRFHVPAFQDAPEKGVVLPRWQPDYDRDWKESEKEDFAAQVARRPTAQIMEFADYNHDGLSTEFYLQSEAEPCGKSYGFVVGVTRTNGRLHVLGTAAEPNKPLYMLKSDWEALRRAEGPTEVIDWQCEDHGADVESTVRLGWTPRGITMEPREWTCPGGFKSGKLIPKDNSRK